MTDTDTARTEAEAIAELVRDETALHFMPVADDQGGQLAAVIYHRDGQKVDTLDLERYRDKPQATRGTVRVHTPDGLIAYASRHVNAHESTLWGDGDARTVTVILNDHGNHDADNRPGWGDHRAVLQLQHSPEWKAWSDIDGQWLAQVELAEFLEEHLDDIVQPDGATMLEVAHTFQATTGARFKSSQSLHSGEQQLVYEQDIDAKAGTTGSTEVPREFTLSVAPFVGTDPVELSGRFRFRVREGRLTLGVRLLGLEQVVRDAMDAVLERVSSQLDLYPIAGSAPSSLR